MTNPLRLTTRRVVVALTALATALPVATLASPAVADTRPADPATPVTISADALPTVQIDGVVWSQAVVGNTVYAGGEFQTARPAGSAAGVNTVPRHNLLAYDIRTGALIDSFDHDLNGQVLSVATSPDGTRLYVTGDFTQIDGQWRVRIAAFDTATGALLPGFAPALGARGLAVTASASTVYVGGNFSSVSSSSGGTLVPRQSLAAFDAATGAVLPFQADANAPVAALAVTADGAKLVVGGRFTTLGGANAYGLGWVDPTTGTPSVLPVNAQVRDAGTSSGITSLYADASGIYGSGYHFGSGGNLEGTFRADPTTGSLVWVADCHGDTYSVYPAADVVYSVGHAHYCGNVPGGFPQTTPWTYHHMSAFSKAPSGNVNTPDIYGYGDHPGQAAPSWLYVWPQFYTGTYTGQGQAGWSISGNGQYVVMGGEFIGVNGKAQQGLVRFTTRDNAPNKQGPRLSGTDFPVKAVSDAPGEVRLTWTGNYDRDNATLTYRVYRGTTSSEPLTTRTATAMTWDEPTLGFTDTGRTPGATEQYLVTASDPYGNTASSAWVSVTVAGSGTTSAYESVVRASEPYAWWRLGEASGTTLADSAGFDPARSAGSGVTLGTAGAIAGDPDRSATFNGSSSGNIGDTVPTNAPDAFSVEAWFSTTSNRGGKIVGFGSSSSGTSSSADRHLYLDNAGRVYFGVVDGSSKTVQTPTSYANGAWHHVVGTYAKGTMRLYVDGVEIASRSDVTYEKSYWGYWRIGGDRLSGWPAAPASQNLNGKIDEVAVYRRVLSPAEVASHRTAGVSGALGTNIAPTAAILASSSGATATLDGASSTDRDGRVVAWDWTFGDGATGTGATTSHQYAESGTYTVGLTVTDDRGATTTTTAQVTVVRPANQAPIAVASATVSGLTATLSGTGSLDLDGSVVGYAWDFGDGTTGSGATTQHAYAAAGTYTATLTVTDDRGAQASTTAVVQVSAQLAADSFTRTQSSSWGTANVGGQWTTVGTAPAYSVASGAGRQSIPAGSTRSARLDSVSSSDTDMQVTATIDKDQTGGGTYVTLLGRRVGTSEYTARAKVGANGSTVLQILSGSTTLASATLPTPYVTGSQLALRFQVVGTSPTSLKVKAWRVGTTEPGWQVSTTDSTAALQAPGSIGLGSYLSGSATNAPMTVTFDDLVAYPSGSVPPPNQAPTAAFIADHLDLVASLDASGSTDPEGGPLTYAWSFGDGTTGTGAATSHTYAAAGTYTVSLTVTDNAGATATTSQQVSVTPPNQAPTASFTSSVADLTASFDGSASADPDGQLQGLVWDFGDGTGASGAQVQHTYAAGGTYQVTLTVTDDKGASGSLTTDVTVTDPIVALAQDGFTRTVTGGWGTAEAGGTWSVAGTAANYAVNGSAATQTIAAGGTRSSYLSGVASTSTSLQVSVALDKAQTGGGTYVTVVGRRVASTDLGVRLKFLATGVVQAQAMTGGTALATASLPGTYTPGTQLRVRLDVTGTSPTTIRAKVWAVGSPEPTAWTVQATDATAAVQAPGTIGLVGYLSGSATNAPMTVTYDDLVALPAG